ncbi:hypothetical protein GGF42_009201, partial [Coemansia sp. RSA 2424]
TAMMLKKRRRPKRPKTRLKVTKKQRKMQAWPRPTRKVMRALSRVTTSPTPRANRPSNTALARRKKRKRKRTMMPLLLRLNQRHQAATTTTPAMAATKSRAKATLPT